MAHLTMSERLFEDACASLGLSCSRICEERSQTPDYRVELSGHVVFAEVKQLDENDSDRRAWEECRRTGSAGSFPASDDRVRKKLHKANPQLKRRNQGLHPGVLVLYSNTSLGAFDAQDLHDAMYGSETHTIAYPRDRSGEPVYLGASLANDGRLKESQNTSTSAVISLNHSSRDGFTIYVYHNRFAKNPLDPEWLRGNGVRHFASKDRPGSAIPGWVEI